MYTHEDVLVDVVAAITPPVLLAPTTGSLRTVGFDDAEVHSRPRPSTCRGGPRVAASPKEKLSSIFLHPENSEVALGLILRAELALWGASDARLVVDVVVDGYDDAFAVRLIPDLLCPSHL